MGAISVTLPILTANEVDDTSITVNALEKSYGKAKALNGLSFSVPSGTIFGLLGPNGAGKSTLMKILATTSNPDHGSVSIGGFSLATNAQEVRRLIGVVPQRSGADRASTAIENLWMQGILYGLRGPTLRKRIQDLLRHFELADVGDRLVRTFSGGMVRKLDLALGLIHQPRVLLLDEPTVGLDPTARGSLWQHIQELSANGLTVLLTTHHLEEADFLTSTIAIMDRGQIVVQGAPSDLKADLAGDALEVTFDRVSSNQCLIECLDSLDMFRELQIDNEELRVRTDNGSRSAPALLTALAAIGINVRSLRISGPSLEDVYKRHTGSRFPAAN